jgi:hypothetical protein
VIYFVIFPIVTVLASSAIACFFILRFRWALITRAALAGAVLLVSHALTAIWAYAFADIDANSYYARSVELLLDETIGGLEAGDPELLSHLKKFRSEQRLTYENRGELLENVERFRAQGESRRTAPVDDRPAE